MFGCKPARPNFSARVDVDLGLGAQQMGHELAGSSASASQPASVDGGALAGSAFVNAAAAGGAASIVMFAIFPVDVAKTHAQAHGGSMGTMVTQLQQSPMRSLYRGITPAIAESVLNRFMLFGLGSCMLARVPAAWPEPARDAAAGGSAAFLKTALLHPIDSVKTRRQLGMGWGAHGIATGLYNGLGPATLRSSVGMAIWLTTRNSLERSLPDDTPTWRATRHLVSGALSSLFTDAITFPLDTLKKILQSRASADVGVAEQARVLMRDGGVARFYRGYAARVFLVCSSGAIFNTAYVSLQRLLSPLEPGAEVRADEVS